MVDWSIGQYERTALELAPVTEHVIELGRLQPGLRVVDLATGTGNAALAAARHGAVVTGIDTATRLIQVARERAAAEGLAVTFLEGDVQQLPFDDRAFDVAISVFGLIFAPDPDRAFAEMIRVLAPTGRALVTVWVPEGPIFAMVSAFGRAVAAATGEVPRRFAWHDVDTVRELAARHGATIDVHDAQLTITAESPEAYVVAGQQHPGNLAARPILEQAGTYAEVSKQALAILSDANQDPTAFRVTSPYRIYDIRRIAPS